MVSLERHFVRGSVLGLLRRGHPYDFLETYQTLRALYGYESHYVNLGLWTDGEATTEAGRRLALRVAEPLGLGAGDRLVDAGSGLGQAAVDLARLYQLGAVYGVNVNPRQVAFAQELAAEAGLSAVIEHACADACTALAELPAGCASGVIAIECAGHFADPRGFLCGAHHVLAPGRRLSICLNVSSGPSSRWDRALIRASFGFVPETAELWEERLRSAGFADVTRVDLTSQVTGALARIIGARLDCPTEQVRSLPAGTRRVIRLLHDATRSAVEHGRVKYLLLHAERP